MTQFPDATQLLPTLVNVRRQIHANPELGMELPLTRAVILEQLEPLGLDIHLSKRSSAVTAVLEGAETGPTVLLRGDMDALPIEERTGLEYAATGAAMHACGHDLHVAGLIGAAHLLRARRSAIRGSVIFMFQPAEELGIGARSMIEDGVLEATGEKPVAAYGIHVVPGEFGVFSTRPGTIMAGSLELNVTVKGSGGHASAPHAASDPVPALVATLNALTAFRSRRFDAFDPLVLTVTRVRAGGEAANIIGDDASFTASIRVLSAQAQKRVEEELPVVIEKAVGAYGCSAEVDLQVNTPTTINNEQLALDAIQLLGEEFGDERVWRTPNPVMGSEDFSHVLQRVPGVLLFLRASPVGLDLSTAAPLHSPHVIFDDSVLADQAVALAKLALSHVS